MAFNDHFSTLSRVYADFRPTYPAALAEFLAGIAPGRALAWDCGTGQGQAARLLAPWFERVVATDASPQQIAQATPIDRVTFAVAPAQFFRHLQRVEHDGARLPVGREVNAAVS